MSEDYGFSDEDLSRLKEHIGEFVVIPMERHTLEALIRRLEASERFSHVLWMADNMVHNQDVQKAQMVWRMAAGK